MRFILILSAVLASCSAPTPLNPVSKPSEQATTSSPEQVSQTSLSAPKEPPPTSSPSVGPISAPSFIQTSLSGISIEAVSFDARSHYLAVADQVGGPGSMWPDCRAAGEDNGGIAAINAGFFTPEGKPLGKVIADGKEAGQLNRASSLGSGFYTRSSSGSMKLIRRDRFNTGQQALQSGPFLVERGRAVSSLSEKQSTARTFIANDGGTEWIMARTGACSLADLSKALEGRSIGSVRIDQALNLDGGRSSEIWASKLVPNGPIFERPFWNKPVRNYLILKSKR